VFGFFVGSFCFCFFLPGHIMISDVSLGEFAGLVGVSVPTLRSRLADAPDGVILSRGKNGESYKIDPRAGVAWWKSLAAAAEAERNERIEKIQSLQLELLGDDTALGSHEIDGLTPAEQNAQLAAELTALKLGRERGELVRASDVEAAAGSFMMVIKDRYTTMVDRLRKRVDLSEDIAATLDKLVQRDLHDLADAAARLGETAVETQEGAADSRAL
jgi:hypothetical protein